jgi:hypothetical protein
MAEAQRRIDETMRMLNGGARRPLALLGQSGGYTLGNARPLQGVGPKSPPFPSGLGLGYAGRSFQATMVPRATPPQLMHASFGGMGPAVLGRVGEGPSRAGGAGQTGYVGSAVVGLVPVEKQSVEI